MNESGQRMRESREALFEAATRDANPRSVVAALSAELPCELLLFDQAGEALARSTRAEAALEPPFMRDLWELVAPHSFGAPLELNVDDRRIDVRPLRTAGSVANVLVAVSHRSRLTEQHEELLEFGARIIELLLGADSVAARARQRNRSDLLDLILAQQADNSHVGWLIAHGFAAGNELQALIVAGADAQTQSAAEDFLGAVGATHLSTRADSFVVLLVSIPPNAPARRRGFDAGTTSRQELAGFAREHGISVGVSTSLRGLSTVPILMRQATLALKTAMDDGLSMLNYPDLPGLVQLVDSLPEDTTRRLAGRLAPLVRGSEPDGHDVRVKTIHAFLAHDSSISKTASILHLHPNSLRKRLRSIEGTLGMDVTTTDGVVEAQLSLLAAQVLSARALLPAHVTEYNLMN